MDLWSFVIGYGLGIPTGAGLLILILFWTEIIDYAFHHRPPRLNEEGIHRCGRCGAELQAVRPGKWQCNYCDSHLGEMQY